MINVLLSTSIIKKREGGNGCAIALLVFNRKNLEFLQFYESENKWR